MTTLQRKGEGMNNYTFEMMYEDLRNGYQIYYTYVKNRYLLFRTAKNCYTQKLISNNDKNPHPRQTMLTLKRVKEVKNITFVSTIQILVILSLGMVLIKTE